MISFALCVGINNVEWIVEVIGFVCSSSLFVDGIDGKQARRIGLSGPLGELFDHGK